MLAGGPILHAIAVSSELAIPDLLADGPRTAAALARATGSHDDALYRLMRGLASAGVFAELPRRRFALTPISQLLRSGVPGSMRSVAVLAGEPWRRAWYELPYAVRKGRPAFERGHDAQFYDWLATNRVASRRFSDALSYTWETLADEVVSAYDFSRASEIVDVGGGSGALIEAILTRYPEANGALLETPSVATEARRRLRAAGLGRRCRVIGGDFIRSVPHGGGLYILAFVLHNWDDRRATRILANCQRAMAPGGRLLVVESVIPPGTGPSPAKIHDLEMLVFMPGGRERTRSEYRALFAAAHLRLRRVTPTQSSVSLLEGVAAPAVARRPSRAG
jgi:SAM-dependent methyltransferase